MSLHLWCQFSFCSNLLSLAFYWLIIGPMLFLQTAKIQEIIAVESRQSADTKCSALITERDLLKEQSIYYKREVERLVTQLTEKSKTVEELSVGNNKLEAELQAIKDNILALRREVKEDQAASTQLSWRLQRTEEYLQRRVSFRPKLYAVVLYN